MAGFTEALRDIITEIVDPLCKKKSSEDVIVSYTIKGHKVTITESRPFFIDPSLFNTVNVAQFEYVPDTKIWLLHWFDMKNKRKQYPVGRNRDTLDRLIREVDLDPTGVFWE